MFSAVTKYTMPTYYDLCDVHAVLSAYDKTNLNDGIYMQQVTKRCKGKLGKNANSATEVGSVHVSMTFDKTKCSLMIFKNSIKISGGIPKCIQDMLHEHISYVGNDILYKYIKIITDTIVQHSAGVVVDCFDARLVNLNATYRGKAIDDFMAFCQTKLFKNKDLCCTCYLPLTFDRGAFTACQLYPFPTTNCSAKIQHTGSIQYMGFKDVDAIHVYSNLVNEVLY